MRLSTRLMIAMVGLVLLTTTAVGLVIHQIVERTLLPHALERVETQARLRATELESYVLGARADVLGFRSAAALDGIMQARLNGGRHPLDGTSEDVWRERMASRYAVELALKPSYLQFRIIGVADGGREIVRVDRSGPDGAVRVVPAGELQRKGDRDYFTETIGLAPRGVYISPIDLNQEHGVIEVPHVPVLRVATPIHASDGAPFGIVIINLDMRPVLARIRAAMSSGQNVYLVNSRGDFLLHPDPRREFGFEFGTPSRIQDELPNLATVLPAADARTDVILDAAGRRFGVAVVPVHLASQVPVTLIETARYADIMAPAEAVQHASLLVGIAAVLGAIVLAVMLARSLLAPLAKMMAAVQAFARDEPIAVPTGGGGEIGVLARAFAGVAQEVQDKAAELRHEARERERVLARLAESLARQQAIFTCAPVAILTLNESGSIETLNPAAERMFGVAGGAMARRDLACLIAIGGSADRNSASFLREWADQGGVRELLGRRSEGTNFPIELAIGRMPIGERRLFVVFARDLRDRKIAEEKFRLAVESSPSGIIMTGGDGAIMMVNAETEKLFGYRRRELIGQSIDLLVPMRFRADHLRHRENFGARPRARTIGARRELYGRRKDGSEFPVEIGLNPIQTRSGLVILSVIIDISERRRNECLKDEFVATVSHELRTPLTSIAGSLGLLLGGAAGALPASAHRLLSIASANSQRLVRLINDILDIEKMESGRITFDFKPVDIRAIVEQAIEANRGYAESFATRLVLEPGSESCIVRADIDRMIQVVTNLLSNAIKFSPTGEEVAVAIERRGDAVRISVRDHGPGIPDDFKSRIFEKFAQADSSDSRKKGGTGLGLNIARQIVLQHGGTVGFGRAAGGGTVFHFELPAAPVAPAGGAGADPLQPRILLCDDDPAVCDLVAASLRQAGFAVDVASNATAALARAAEGPHAAFLIDLVLPDLDGVTLIQRLRNDLRYAATPTIVVSADPESGRADVRSSFLDVLAWIAKPVDVDRLVQVIGGAIAAKAGARPRILHVEDDPDVQHVVAEVLRAEAEVTSVGSLDEARRALAAGEFDLALLDLALADGFGCDLLPDLHGRGGHPLPVVIFSAQEANAVLAGRVDAVLTKSRTSIDALVGVLRDVVARRMAAPRPEKEVA